MRRAVNSASWAMDKEHDQITQHILQPQHTNGAWKFSGLHVLAGRLGVVFRGNQTNVPITYE